MEDLVANVYDCVADPDEWKGALRRICDQFSGMLGMLAVVDTATNNPRFISAHGQSDMLRQLMERYAGSMPFYSAIPKLSVDVPVTIDTIYDLQGPGARQAWLSSDMWQNWSNPTDIDDCFWLPVLKSHNRVANLIVVTGRDRHQITASELTQFATISPHVRRAVTVGELIDIERRRADAFAEVLQVLAYPVIIVGRNLEIRFINAAGEALLHQNNLIALENHRLRLVWEPARKAVEKAVHLGSVNEFALETLCIGAPLHAHRQSSIVYVLPLARRERVMRVEQNAVAAIFVTPANSSDIQGSPSLEAIAALFGLSAAEKRVAGQVADGLSRQEIAQINGVTDGTVKSQLSAIFDKMDVSDQRSLQAMISDLSPPFVWKRDSER
jgi:DNA-binding CsgD family transcriptional regulator